MGKKLQLLLEVRQLARIVPISKKDNTTKQDNIDIFGMWKGHNDEASVEDIVRDLRKGRTF